MLRLFSAMTMLFMPVHSVADADQGAPVMDELVSRIVTNIGVDAALAQRAVGIILAFLAQEGPADKVDPLIDAMPGAREAVQAQGPVSGGVMGAGMKLMSAGLGMGQIQNVVREVIGYARETAGRDTVDALVASIPGLGQYV